MVSEGTADGMRIDPDASAIVEDSKALHLELLHVLDQMITDQEDITRRIEHEVDNAVASTMGAAAMTQEAIIAELEEGLRAACHAERMVEAAVDVEMMTHLQSALGIVVDIEKRAERIANRLQARLGPPTMSTGPNANPNDGSQAPQPLAAVGSVSVPAEPYPSPAAPAVNPFPLFPAPPARQELGDLVFAGQAQGVFFPLQSFPPDFWQAGNGMGMFFSTSPTPISRAQILAFEPGGSTENAHFAVYLNISKPTPESELDAILGRFGLRDDTFAVWTVPEAYLKAVERFGEVSVRNVWDAYGIPLPTDVDAPGVRAQMGLSTDQPDLPVNAPGLPPSDAAPKGEQFASLPAIQPPAANPCPPTGQEFTGLLDGAYDAIFGGLFNSISQASRQTICALITPIARIAGIDPNTLPPCVDTATWLRQRDQGLANIEATPR